MSDGLVLIALGIALGMYFFSRTGYSPGGIITPGLLAMDLNSPVMLGTIFACAAMTAFLLSAAIKSLGLYGRQRTAAAMLIALLIKALLGAFLPLPLHWTGWVIPGLIGADMERQGAFPTVAASLAVAFATSMAGSLLYSLSGGWQ
ncbi:MAG: capsule biosynthesis protein CapC [Synergistaceae bacterium]|nr:capsule biosynthesis protein CapC [Synergistaceae bacterium]